jgi:zinc protease
MKKQLVALTALMLIGNVWSQNTNSVSQQRKINFVEYDLPNGLHVILHEEHSIPITAVSIMYHVGSKNEKADRTGFAHFFEHLLFEGSENIKRGEYAQIVEKNGGTLNANTSQDRTYYFEILPSNQTELGLWLESERLLHARVENTGIETQRQVVKEEKRQRVDNQPYATFLPTMCSKVFKKHPYNWVPIGSMEHLDAAQEEDYINFYKTFYVPNNAVLSIAGDINISQTKKWIEKYFGSIPKGQAINLYRDFLSLNDSVFENKYSISKSKFDKKDFFKSKNAEAIKTIKKYEGIPTIIPTPNVIEEPLTSQIIDTVYDNIQLPAVFIGYRFPAQTDKDYPAVEVLNNILSGSASSRMNKSIVEKKELAVTAFSFGLASEDPGLGLVAGIGSNGVSLDTLLLAMDEEIERTQNELVSQEELEMVLNQYENQIVSSNSSVAGIAENLADNFMYRKNTNLVNKQLDNYLTVTREDIQRVAKKYFTKNARVILFYLPKSEN